MKNFKENSEAFLPEYPYQPGKFGFLFWEVINRPEENFTFYGESSLSIKVIKTSYKLVFVSQTEQNTFTLWAQVDPEGVAKFYVNTKYKSFIDFEYQPDFFAARFITCALAYFNKFVGTPVNSCLGRWYSDSDNYQQYFKNILSGAKPQKAALQT